MGATSAGGVPVVAVRASGVTEAVSPGVGGVLVEPGDLAGFTERILELASDDARARMAERVPLGRLGRLNDIAAMALFLGSEDASYITGALIPVDGGISLLGARNHAIESGAQA